MYLTNKYKKYGIDQKVNMSDFMPMMFSGVDVSIVNSLRRIFVSEIDNLAVADKIELKMNTSQYHREVLLDRFGFITLNMEYIDREQLDETEIRLILCDEADINKPLRNNSASILKVFIHSHIKYFYKEQEQPIQEICPFNSILLTLNPKEEILAVMIPTMGHGHQHPRWNSSIVMYKFGTSFDDNVNNVHIETNSELMSYKGKDIRTPESILVTIESIGKMHSFTVLNKGLLSFKHKLMRTISEINQIPASEKISIETDDLIPNFFKYHFDDEDHTLGRVLEYACLEEIKKLVAQDDKLLLDCLCGYRKPHPLDNYMELIIKLPPSLNIKPNELVVKSIEMLVELCDKLLADVKRM